MYLWLKHKKNKKERQGSDIWCDNSWLCVCISDDVYIYDDDDAKK